MARLSIRATNSEYKVSTPPPRSLKRTVYVAGIEDPDRDSQTVLGRYSQESRSNASVLPHQPTSQMHRAMDSEQPHSAGKYMDIARFRLNDLPVELRLHIFRAALVRPYPVVMHKEPLPAPSISESQPSHQSSTYAEYDLPEVQQVFGEAAQQADGEGLVIPSTPPQSSRSPRGRRTRGSSRSIRSTGSFNGSTSSMSGRPSRTSPRRIRVRAPRLEQELLQQPKPVRDSRPQDDDPLNPKILRLSHEIYKEARQIMYAENVFILNFSSAISTITSLHQRSRSMIRHVQLTVPCASDILDDFAEIVRLALRYCWGLKTFTVILPFRLAGDETVRRGQGHNTTMHMYANAFNILRWLPRSTEVTVQGDVCDEIRETISQNAAYAKMLDEKAYAKRQHQISERPE